MLDQTLSVSETYSIPVQYCDVDFIETLQKKASVQSSIAYRISTILKNTGSMLMVPFDKSTALFARGHHLTPGKHVAFSDNPLTHSAITSVLSFGCYTAGTISGLLSAIPAGIGVGCHALANQFHESLLECEAVDDDRQKSTRSKSKKSTFKLLTRNTALVPAAISNYSNLRDNDERLLEIADSIQDSLDVACFQEVFVQERSQRFIDKLKGKFKYFIYNVAPHAFGLESGLVFASNCPIICARFVRPPLPTFIKADNPLGMTTSIESFTNKGMLFVLVKDQDVYKLVVNAHIKSNMSFDHEEAREIERIRAEGLRVLTLSLFEYMEYLENQREIKINQVILGGDLNVSDFQETGIWNYERSGMKNNIRIRQGLADLSFMFEGLFPGPSIDTWLLDESRKPNQSKTGYGQRNYNQLQKPLKHVRFDHAGVFQNHVETDLPPKKRTPH